MIHNINITGLHLELDAKTKKYVRQKVGKLDRYIPRHARKSAKAEAVVKQVNKAHGNKYEVEVLLHLPDQILTAKDSTLNILAATDIVEAKLTSQLRKYKQLHTDHRGRHGLLARFKQSFARES
jgi:putative sigma-54 modulation protein